jgi:quercetin dioxygenase-like cupin family protein
MDNREIGNGSQALDGLVDYQQDAVVSRTILKKDTGTVTVFAFDRDQALSEHSVPHDALVHVFDGQVEITIGGEPHRVEQGQLILMPADVPHAVRAVERFKMVLIMLR